VVDNSTERGRCDFCGATGVPLADVSTLSDAFANAVSIYSPVEIGGSIPPWAEPWHEGEFLHVLLDEDWGVFGEAVIDRGKEGDLLQAILAAGWDDDSGDAYPDRTGLFTRRSFWLHQTPAEEWEEFSSRVRADGSIEPQLPPALEEDIFGVELEVQRGTAYFRARKGFDTDPYGRKVSYCGSAIGAPPPDSASPSRANEWGTVVLYVAEDELTAVAECRPARGIILSLGHFESCRNLRLLDLAGEIGDPDPFTTDGLRYSTEFAGLMRAFAWSLSQPLERDDTPEEYRPTQKLTAYVRERGFDGIRYPSAMKPGGVNVVLFDPNSAVNTAGGLVEVTQVTWEYEEHDQG
jgi:RES domain-containing protein